jgi:hypothetical protein
VASETCRRDEHGRRHVPVVDGGAVVGVGEGTIPGYIKHAVANYPHTDGRALAFPGGERDLRQTHFLK